MAARVPPHNLEAERSVLGSILLDSKTLINIADVLKSEHFYDPQHAEIYEAIIDLYTAAKPIDVLTLTNTLKAKKKLAQVGGSAYLTELIANVPTASHIVEYAQIVKQASVRRNLISFAGRLDEQARTEDKELDEVLDEVEKQIFAISQDSSQKDFVHASKLLEMHFEKVEEYSKNPNAMRGIPTGLQLVDEMLGGLHKSDLVIIAARPGVGKSALAFDFARHAALAESKAVGIFSLEMPQIQVMERLLSQEIGVSTWELRMGRLTDDGYARLAEGHGKFAESRLFVDDTPGVNVMQLRSKARKLKLEHGLDLLIIDYLQLMQGTSARIDNRAAEVAEISRSLKILARELEVPVVALSQLNRAVESRTDRMPQLSDLRESGSIEQDADIVIFLNREKTYNPDTERPDIVDFIIAKHRNGPTGRIELKYEDKFTRYRDMPQ